jgi:hypothetical protein
MDTPRPFEMEGIAAHADEAFEPDAIETLTEAVAIRFLHCTLCSLLLISCCILGLWPILLRFHTSLKEQRAGEERKRKWEQEFDELDKDKDQILAKSELPFPCPSWFPDKGITRAEFLQLMDLMDLTEEPIGRPSTSDKDPKKIEVAFQDPRARLVRQISDGDDEDDDKDPKKIEVAFQDPRARLRSATAITITTFHNERMSPGPLLTTPKNRVKKIKKSKPETKSTQESPSVGRATNQEEAEPGGNRILAQIPSTFSKCCVEAATIAWHQVKLWARFTLDFHWVPRILRLFLLLLALQFVPVILLGPFELFIRDFLRTVLEFMPLMLPFGPEMMHGYLHGFIGALCVV